MHRQAPFGKHRVCAVVAATTATEAVHQLRAAMRHTKTAELRLDWLANPAESGKLLSFIRKEQLPVKLTVIATCRRRNAGGKFEGSVIAQLSLLRSATLAGCQWVDVELETAKSVPAFMLDLYTTGARRILSFHDFDGRSQTALHRIARKMEQFGDFDAIKIATKCDTLRDAARLLALARRGNMIAIPLGEAVTPMRILALREGSILAYAPVAGETAPGQIPLSELAGRYHGDNFSQKTRVYGVIGSPIAHSLSPVLHNAGFRARKMDTLYLRFHVADLRDFVQIILPVRISGFSVTLPHKQKIMRYLDGCDSLAHSIGAVNTVAVRENGKLFGYNTDSIGLLGALGCKLSIRGLSVLILGAGGVARTAAFTLRRAGASVFICSRRMEQGRRLARAAGAEAVRRQELNRRFFDVIINATPVGMHPHVNQSPLAASELNCALAFDTVYRPQETKFLRLGRQKGIKTVSGVEMFLAQGIAQWELWTGRRAPVRAMRNAVLAALRDDERAFEKRRA